MTAFTFKLNTPLLGNWYVEIFNVVLEALLYSRYEIHVDLRDTQDLGRKI